MAQDTTLDDGGLFDTAPLADTAATLEVPLDAGGLFDDITPLEGLAVSPVGEDVPQAKLALDAGGLFDTTLQDDTAFQGLLAQGDRPDADETFEAGFGSSFSKAIRGSYSALIKEPAGLFADMLVSVAEEYAPGGELEAWAKGEQVRLANDSLRLEQFNRARPDSPDYTRINADDTTMGQAFDLFMESDDTWTIVKEVAGGSLPGTLALAGGYAARGLKGVFGMSAALGFGDEYRESVRQGKGKDEALVSALVKTTAQAGFDTLSFAFPAKVKLANKYADIVTQLAVQTILGGGAEAVKHIAVGEEFSGGRVAVAGAGELLGAPLDIAVARTERSKLTKMERAKKLVEDLHKMMTESAFQEDKKDVKAVLEELTTRAESVAAEDPVARPEDLKATPGLDSLNVATATTELDQVELNQRAEFTVVEAGQESTKRLDEIDWEKTPVVIANETDAAQDLADLQEKLVAQEKALEGYTQVEAAGTNPEAADLRVEAEQEVKFLKQATAILEDFLFRETETLKVLQKAVAKWVETFAPEMKVIVGARQIGKILSEVKIARITQNQEAYTVEDYSRAVRRAQRFDMASTENIQTVGHQFKLLNGVSVLELPVNKYNGLEGKLNQAEYLETAAHEFAHGLVSQMIENVDQKVLGALFRGYRKWLKRLEATQDSKTFHRILEGAATAAPMTSSKKPIITKPGYVYNFDEYIANQMSKALGNNKLVGTPVEKFFREALALLREFYMGNKEYLPEPTFTDFINLLAAKQTLSALEQVENSKDVQTQEQVQQRARATVAAILESSNLKPRKRDPVGRNYGEEEYKADMDKYNFVLKWGVTLIQIGKLNKHIPGLQRYVDLIKEWWNDKNQKAVRAQERLGQWNKLRKKDGENLGRFMQELTVKSYEDGARYKPGDTVWERLARKHKMSDDMLALADMIEQDFEAVLTELEGVQVDAAVETFSDPVAREAAVKEIEGNFAALRERNFFPLSRFGDFFIRIRAEADMLYEGREYKAGETLTFETFENQGDMKARQKVFGNRKKYIIEGGLMNNTQKQFAGFPPQLLSMLKGKLNLDEKQSAEFADIINDLAPGKSFTKHMLHRKNTPGFSTDAKRSYANYFLHFGNYVARIKYKTPLLNAIKEVGNSAGVIAKRTGDGTKRTRIQQFMENHYEGAMNPGNELANLRALGFLWYLGFVPKSAVVNFTQVPLVTLPFLSARYGDVQALRALGKATVDAGRYWKNPQKLSEGQIRMIDTLVKSGILDESLATELAAASEGGLLNRIAPGKMLGSEKAARMIRQGAGAGAWMFQQAEKTNRRVTALAAYDLARKAGNTHAEAVGAAKEAVETTQFEYARWNRPRFMAGKKSVMFLFWQYMQNSIFFLATDPGKVRYLMVMLLFAGVSGLPFAEDIMTLWDYLAKKANKVYGEDFAPDNLKLEARKLIQNIGANPDLVMHGSSRYSFGLAALGDQLGVPIPNTDMSGSLSMGSLVPGLDPLLSDTPFDKGLGRAAEDLGGAVLAMPVQLMRAISDSNPDTLKRFEKAMPSFAKNLSKAYRRASRGEETLPDGTVITEFNLDDSLHRNEIIAQALGFQTTRVADAQEPYWMTREILTYYTMRRGSLMEMLDYAKRSGDSEMYRKTWQEVRKFNNSLKKKGLGRLGIRPKEARKSLKNRRTRRIMQEKGFAGGKRGAPVSQEVYDAFPSSSPVR